MTGILDYSGLPGAVKSIIKSLQVHVMHAESVTPAISIREPSHRQMARTSTCWKITAEHIEEWKVGRIVYTEVDRFQFQSGWIYDPVTK